MMTICLIIIDQIIKMCIVKNIYNSSFMIINKILKLTYVENTGGAFGIGSNSTFILIIVNSIIIGLLGNFIVSKKDNISMVMLSGFIFILSGGIGNLIDRVFRGFVVDYIDFNPLISYPVFNFADICVVLGCLIIGIYIIVETTKNKKE